MTEVFIICPGDSVSGGPEACHQLAHTLNSDHPGRAALVYHPFNGPYQAPWPFRGYDAPVADVADITPGSTVVLPEVYPQLLPNFPGCQVFYWWLSVDNFRRGVRPAWVATHLAALRRHAAKHLYQSHYAQEFLTLAGLTPAARLSDQLSDGFIRALAKPPTGPRRDLLVHNPAKGFERTQLILKVLAKGLLREPPDVIALQDLGPGEVRKVLSAAKVYIDFGGHPGKDRLPREAAALGCCVLTNRRGAAANPVDVPIPDEFKIDDRRQGFEKRAAAKIRLLLDDYHQQAPRFDAYRRIIAGEPDEFLADVRSLFPVKVGA